jgi:hypothetical protein
MGSKHIDTPMDLDKAYETNEIGIKGIAWFAIGLLILIVVTFVLISTFLYKLQDYSAQNAGPPNPMAMSERDKLPPEPRLQAAPGFGVDRPDGGRVNLELTVSQSEYRELRKQWDKMQKEGRMDAATGTVTAMPIDQAKEKFLASAPKAKMGPDGEKALSDSRMFVSDSSAGRMAAETRR